MPSSNLVWIATLGGSLVELLLRWLLRLAHHLLTNNWLSVRLLLLLHLVVLHVGFLRRLLAILHRLLAVLHRLLVVLHRLLAVLHRLHRLHWLLTILYRLLDGHLALHWLLWKALGPLVRVVVAGVANLNVV